MPDVLIVVVAIAPVAILGWIQFVFLARAAGLRIGSQLAVSGAVTTALVCAAVYALCEGTTDSTGLVGVAAIVAGWIVVAVIYGIVGTAQLIVARRALAKERGTPEQLSPASGPARLEQVMLISAAATGSLGLLAVSRAEKSMGDFLLGVAGVMIAVGVVSRLFQRPRGD